MGGRLVMRVLLVNKYAHVTWGADRYCLALTRLLREAGHDVRWLSTASPANEERDGAFVAPHAGRALWNRAAAAAADGLLRDFRPHVVHCHKLYPHLSVAPVLRAASAGAPIVQTAHDYELCSAEERLPRRVLVARAGTPERRAAASLLFPVVRALHVPRLDAVVAPTRFVAAALQRAGIEACVVPHFVAPAPGPPRPHAERRGVLFAGRLVPEKGVDDVLRLAELVRDVDVAGAGPLAEAVRTSRARHLGALRHADVLERIARARAVVMPSRWEEPAGLVALEAAAAGTPVVAYRVGGLAEQVETAGGVLVHDVAAMAAAVQRLDADQGEWARRSSAALEAARTVHAPERHLAALEAVYRSVV